MKDETKNRIRVISWILFVIYIGLLIYFLFLSEEYGADVSIQSDTISGNQKVLDLSPPGRILGVISESGRQCDRLPSVWVLSSDSEQTITEWCSGNYVRIRIKSSGGVHSAYF